MGDDILGAVAEWISAIGSITAAVVAWAALKYAKGAYEAQNAQLQIHQQELKEDMLTRKRLRLSGGPIFKVSSFEHFIDGLELESGTVIRSEIIVNPGAWQEKKNTPVNFESMISAGYRCLAIHNYRSVVRLGLVKIRSIDSDAGELHVFRVKIVKRFHINFDWKPDQMWAILVPEKDVNTMPLRILLDFDTEDKFFDRYEMELDLVASSIKQVKPIPLFEEAYEFDQQ